MAVAKKPAAPEINLFSNDFYAGGGLTLPEGDYIWTKVDVVMFQPKKKDGTNSGESKLGVIITTVPLEKPDETPHESFYSMGSKAHLSFAPNPETGKGLVAIPGGPGTTLQTNTNWDVLRKSLMDCDPNLSTILSNDVSVLEGMHVHMMPIPEPEERKQFKAVAATGEAAEQQKQYDNKIAVVTEIKEDGKPWEGTGGMPTAKAATKPNGKVAPAKAAAPKPAAKAAPAPEPAAEGVDDTITDAASRGITGVLEKAPNGMPRIKLRTETFKYLKASKMDGEEVANAVVDQVFESEDVLSSILGGLGYEVKGTMVSPA